jgi:hypothetical protein
VKIFDKVQAPIEEESEIHSAIVARHSAHQQGETVVKALLVCVLQLLRRPQVAACHARNDSRDRRSYFVAFGSRCGLMAVFRELGTSPTNPAPSTPGV